MIFIRLSWAASVIAMFGSLFFSEVMKFIPCNLCWYQRILMYPIAIIMTVALFKNKDEVVPYVLPLSIIGMCVSLYHYLLQKVDFVREIGTCTVGVPCNAEYINWLGFITIPFLALIAFTIITVCLVLNLKSKKQ